MLPTGCVNPSLIPSPAPSTPLSGDGVLLPTGPQVPAHSLASSNDISSRTILQQIEEKRVLAASVPTPDVDSDSRDLETSVPAHEQESKSSCAYFSVFSAACEDDEGDEGDADTENSSDDPPSNPSKRKETTADAKAHAKNGDSHANVDAKKRKLGTPEEEGDQEESQPAQDNFGGDVEDEEEEEDEEEKDSRPRKKSKVDGNAV